MKRNSTTILILFSFLFVNLGQRNVNDENELTELQKQVEDYIIEKFNCKHHLSIEFNDKKLFDINQLIADYKYPEIFKDEPRAFKDNEKALDWLEKANREADIAYSMAYIFGLKDNEDDVWDPFWVLLLLNYQSEIIGHIRYFP